MKFPSRKTRVDVRISGRRSSPIRLETLEDRCLLSTFTVNTLDDTVDFEPSITSLREAIIAANSQVGDDIINFSVTGTINRTDNLPDLSSNIQILGPGAASLTVHHSLMVAGGPTVLVDGLTISDAGATAGGGIYNDGGTLTVSNCTLAGNTAMYGGAICNRGGTLTVTNSTLLSNITLGGYLSIDGYGGGGAICNLGGTLTVTNSTLKGNYATTAGGGIFNLGGVVSVSNSTLEGNSNEVYSSTPEFNGGGGIFNKGGELTVSNTTICYNYVYAYEEFNSDRARGGGIANDVGGTLTVSNCTLAGNSINSNRGDRGPAIWNTVAPTIINNSIVADHDQFFPIEGGVTGSHNLIEGNSYGLTDTITGDPNLGPLTNNGGPTQTMEPLPGSPAIDAGDDALAVGLLTDQRGSPFDRINGAHVDIGAYETPGPTISGTDGDDVITIGPGTQPTTVKVTVNGVVYDNQDGLVIDGLGGSDTYVVTLAASIQTVAIDDTGSAGSDFLIVNGTEGHDHIFKDSRIVTLGTPVQQAILYRGVESLTIHGGAGNDTITDPGSDTQIFGDTGDDTITVADTTGPVFVDGGDGSDTYIIQAGNLQGTVAISDSGTGGTDSFRIVGSPTDVLAPTGTGFTLNGVAIDFDGTVESVLVEGINSAPTIMEVGVPTCTEAELTAQVAATDPDAGDTLTYSVSFVSRTGAGAVNDPTGFSIDSGGLFHWTPGAGQLGQYTFKVTVSDGGASVEQTFVVTTLGVVDGVLTIVGSDGSDRIVVKPTDGDADELTVRVNERDYGFRLRPRDNPDNPYTDVTLIQLHGLGGDDDIIVKPAIQIPSWLYGGQGDDKLKGGDSDDVLLGGDGDDVLVGEAGRDLLIGGTGSDKIVGNAGDDLIIAGSTSYDAMDAALSAIMAEWTSSRSYADRVKNLRGDASSPTFASRANGGIFLAVDGSNGRAVTVFDDGVKDTLTGEGGQDWFLFNADGDNQAKKDKVTDLQASEFADDLDFILNE